MAAGRTPAWAGNGDVAAGAPGPAGHNAVVPSGAQHAIGMPMQGRATSEVPRRAARPRAVHTAHCLYVRPEVDDDFVGTHMRDAIERGGYRAALDYYDGDEAKESDTPWHRLRAKGWLLGRLGLYDRVGAWIEEVASLPDFDHLSAAGIAVPGAPYRTPALWQEAPRPMPRSADHTVTIEPVASTDPGIRSVPGDVWAVMLILGAAGPICSHAGLGAAIFLALSGAGQQMRGPARGGRRYDPLSGPRLHGAPEGCHRWIIADIDFDPQPVNEPHYYYDLTDEGRRALDAARVPSAPWPAGIEAAASGLEGMSIPDLLEAACRAGWQGGGLGRARDGLGRIVGAWRSQEAGGRADPVDAEDQVLVDLGAAVRWPDDDDGPGSAVDHLFCIMTAIESAHAVACEARPSSRAEGAVLQALVGALQDLCRRHAAAVVAEVAARQTGPRAAAARGGGRGQEDAPRRPAYADATPARISDLYYCLAEYCKSRSLAADPCSLPLSEQLTGDERASVIEALTRDNPLYSNAELPQRGG